MNRVFAWPDGQGRRNSPGWQSVAFLLAATVGGTVLGGVLALVGTLGGLVSFQARQMIAVPALFVVVVLQLAGSMGFLPQRRRQVPREWMRGSRLVWTVAFGLTLGVGVVTWLRHAAAYAIPVLLFVLADPALALFCGALFGFARGLSPLWSRLIARTEPAALRLERWLRGRAFTLGMRLSGAFAAGLALAIIVLTPSGPGG